MLRSPPCIPWICVPLAACGSSTVASDPEPVEAATPRPAEATGGPPASATYAPSAPCGPSASDRLLELRNADQADRKAPTPDIVERDGARRAEVLRLLEQDRVCTPADHHHAALVLQHSREPAHHEVAHRLARYAADRDHPGARWLAAASWDRWQVSRGHPQFFGTQLVRSGPEAPWCLVELDPSSTEAAREAWGVKPWGEMLTRVFVMNGTDIEAPTEEAARSLGYVCAPEPWER